MVKKKSLSNMDIALYALYLLGGWQNRIHTEDIALKCFELAPSKFSWVKYHQYPDPSPARFALEEAKNSRDRALIIGGSERKKGKGVFTGWRLSENGVSWIKQNKDRIEAALTGTKLPQNRLIEDRRLKTLINSKAFSKYLAEGEKAKISHAEFAESLVCTINTKSDIMSERIEQLYAAADLLNQEKVKQYLDFYRKHFGKQPSGGHDG